MDANMEQSFNKFKSLVLDDAQKQREEIFSDIEQTKKEELEQKHTEFLGEAYKTIQDNISKIQKANKEKILQKELSAKKELILYREQLVEKIFDDVKARLSEYMNTPEYAQWLNRKIKSALDESGDGDKIVYVSSADEAKVEKCGAEIKTADLFGGVKVSNETRGIIINYSIEELLEEQKSDFLKNSGLTIEI